MAIPEAVKIVVQSSLISFIEQRVPARARDEVDLSYRFRGNSVTIYEVFSASIKGPTFGIHKGDHPPPTVV